MLLWMLLTDLNKLLINKENWITKPYYIMFKSQRIESLMPKDSTKWDSANINQDKPCTPDLKDFLKLKITLSIQILANQWETPKLNKLKRIFCPLHPKVDSKETLNLFNTLNIIKLTKQKIMKNLYQSKNKFKRTLITNLNKLDLLNIPF